MKMSLSALDEIVNFVESSQVEKEPEERELTPEKRNYSFLKDPIINRRNRAIQAIYQFLTEEGLFWTISELEKECGLPHHSKFYETGGTLLEALDVHESYQHSITENTEVDESVIRKQQLLLNLKQISSTVMNDPICNKLFYEINEVDNANLLCMDLFYYRGDDHGNGSNENIAKNKFGVVVGSASKKLVFLEISKNNANVFTHTRIATFSDLKGPPLYVRCETVYRKYLVCGCMDGSIYVIEHDPMEAEKDKDKEQSKKRLLNYQLITGHTKYVVMVKWSFDAKYIISASHDYSIRIFKLRTK
ncbi:hypothetical protein RFI_24206 [Reticulomyxa filosa]|uniref:Uncharacterized protein n=1 Tax=Reticulomyxa filosa TaxID=46433 RepID=X6MIA5_RETFI|nr:hypothetical protein RFI_24206 [Reticulomyxa filosa]|eukprot:ETO13172.1 hypothetical protein RFI_24206 [Reticulomyxa filosa]